MALDQATLWRVIGRFEAERDADRRMLESHEERLTVVEETVSTYTTWATRGGLLILLWGGALILNLNPEQKAEVVSLILKQLAK
jgi:hypothetical protein